MRNPIASVPSDKRPMLLGAGVAAAILAAIFMLSPGNKEDGAEVDELTAQPQTVADAQQLDTLPQTRAPDSSAGISGIAGADSITTESYDDSLPATAPAGADGIYIEPPDMLDAEPTLLPQPAFESGSGLNPVSPPVSSVTELELVRELKLRLEQSEKRLQGLQIRLNEQIQYAQKKANEAQRWQDAVTQLEATMKKIIDDNNRESEQMAKEIEHWRLQALDAGRRNAQLTDQRAARPAVATRQLPVTTSEPAVETPRPLPPLQLQTPAQPRQAPQPVPVPQPQPVPQPVPQPAPQAQPQQPPQGNFTTTCYDPVRGYFSCTVRQ